MFAENYGIRCPRQNHFRSKLPLGNGDGTFQAGATYPVGTGFSQPPDSIVVADFNGDGKLDLAIPDGFGSSTVSILLGNGDGTFQSQVQYATGSSPYSIATADFNGDGKLDLAVTNSDPTANSVSILLGNGDGTFQPHVDYGTGVAPASVATGDFNGDGKLDLATADSGSNTVSILLGNGDGTFHANQDFVVGVAPISILTRDFNGDGTLDLAVANWGSNTVSVLLQAPPVVSLSSTSLSFGNQPVGAAGAAQSVTVTNTGSGILSISSIAFTGPNAGDFGQTNNCGTSVAAGANCTINVTFTPTITGAESATLSVSDNAAGSPQTVGLSGTGTAPSVSLSTTSLSFGNQSVGTTSAASAVTVTNNGTASLTFTNITATGDFAVAASGTTCSASTPVAATSNCVINVTFTPTATGSRSGSLMLADNASGSPQTVSLSGTGTGPVASLSSPLSFLPQMVGTTSSSQTVTLTNTGNANLTLAALGATGPFGIATSGTTCSTSNPVAGPGSCTVAVTFTPTAGGAASGSLSFSDNASGSPQMVSLSGTGTTPVVSLSSPLSFSPQMVGTTSSSQTVTLTSSGGANLTLTAIGATGPFGIATSGTTCSTSTPVAAPGTCTVAVTFTPTAGGASSGSLSFSDNAPNSPQSVALNGTGEDFSFAPPSGSSTSATVAPGSPATYTLSVGGEGGLSGAVNFTCAGAPSEASCTVSPNPATAGSSATNVTVTVTTTAPSITAPRSRPLPPVGPLSPGMRGLWILALALATLLWAIRCRNLPGMSLWRSTMLPLTTGLLLILALAACGGGGSTGGGPPPNPGTPAGTYPLTVTGTAGSGASALSHSVKLTLTVS
ncbi:MAG TPA: choice-of-anchor D domain-containing protein [Terriglobia bacterium]|nr:choice-of-anchor D domain-containing protein [Terriglobia bacterium]